MSRVHGDSKDLAFFLLHSSLEFLATAFYDNAFGSALKVDKFIELRLLQPIKSEHAGGAREWLKTLSVGNG